jgi:aldehyde dehydrogenase (NAD+)
MEFDRDWKHFIDGEFVEASSGERYPVENPATAEAFTEAPDGTAEDINAAVSAATEAFEEWRWMEPRDRGALLHEVADELDEHREELVELSTKEAGKPLEQSRRDVENAAKLARFFGGAADKWYSESVLDSPDEVRKKIREPYGVAGIIIPWNWPSKHTIDFSAPALAAGNTVVLKPAPDTPLCALREAEIFADVLPDGVFNVVAGQTEPGVALTSHEDIDTVAFTGHDKTGEKVLEATAKNITPAMVELGGKNAELVFPDADIDKAVSGVINNSFYNSGQACSDTERLLVHEDVYDEFMAEYTARVEELIVNDGMDESTEIGPLINQGQYDKFQSALDTALEEGAEIAAQSSLPDDPSLESGYFVRPTVLENVDPDMRIACDEVFGPLVAVMQFSDEEEALAIANGTDYGLVSTIWTTDLARAHRLTAKLETGSVAINCPAGGWPGLPFGGYKRSGIGRKKDFTEMKNHFTQVKSVRIDLTDDEYTLSSVE